MSNVQDVCSQTDVGTLCLYIVCIEHGFEREDEETEERVISHTWLFQLMKRGLQGQGTGLQ